MTKHILERYPKAYPFITEGYVMGTDDPNQMGRLKVWCPALDGQDFTVESLPWAEYASPLAGVTTDFPTGRNAVQSNGHVPYGFWAIPKLNAQVLVFLLNGNSNRRFYFASYYDLHRNRGLPAGRNLDQNTPPHQGPWTDTYEPLQPAYNNLRQQFNNDLSNPIAQTRGAYERQAAQAQTEKDGKEGYAPSAADANNFKDPQSYMWVTPGHNMITMSDNPENCRVRVKTCEGNQIILDDTNERIYVSTAKGKTWIELDEDGHIHIYGSQSISVRATQDINLTAGNNVHIEAAEGIHMVAGGHIRASGSNVHLKAGETLAASGCTVDVNGSKTRITGDTVDVKSAGLLALQGSKITANTGTSPTDMDKDQLILPGGPAASASCAAMAEPASIIPAHEPWVRPSNNSRNKHFKG